MNLLEYFPFKEPRPYQLDAVEKIIKAVEDGHRNIILSAPTGTGKSAIAITLAHYYKTAYILTSTKQLQHQYVNEFNDVKTMKGRNNFLCEQFRDIGSITCDNGPCVVQKVTCPYRAKRDSDKNLILNPDLVVCNYWYQKIIGLLNDITVVNYKYAMADFYVEDFIEKEIAIFDEAHSIESEVLSFCEISLNKKSFKRNIDMGIPKFKNINEVIEFLSLAISKLNDKISIAREAKIEAYQDQKDIKSILINDYNLSNDDIISCMESAMTMKQIVLNSNDKREIMSLIKQLNDIEKKISNLLDKISKLDKILESIEKKIVFIEQNPDNWVIDDRESTRVVIKPIEVKQIAKQLLNNLGNINIFLSGSLPNPKKFAENLGITEYYTINIPSIIEPKQRPIIQSYVGSMSSRNIDKTMPFLIQKINDIMEQHHNEKGIIHTFTYSIANRICSKIKSPRLITHNSSNKEEVLNDFKSSNKNDILVSPVVHTGVDFPYDECRFQIIVKDPFPNIGDPQIKARMKKDPEYLLMKRCETLCQEYGRAVRASDDYAVTYILDKNIEELVKNNDFITNYFIEGLGQNDNRNLPLKVNRNINKVTEAINDGYNTVAKLNLYIPDNKQTVHNMVKDFLRQNIVEYDI